VDDHQEEFEGAGFPINDVLTVTIKEKPIADALDNVNTQLSQLQLRIAGTQPVPIGPSLPGLETQIEQCEETIGLLQSGLDAPQKAYQAYLTERSIRDARRAQIIGAADKPDTIEYLKDRIIRATEWIPQELTRLREERRGLMRKLHAQLALIRGTYEELYAPVQKIAAEAATSAHSIQLEFNASLSADSFEANFLDFIHRGRKGTFYGETESRTAVRDLLRAHNFNSEDSVVQFTDAILTALTTLDRDGAKESVPIGSQLREKKTIAGLYDYLFGLDYLEVRYNLRLGGKDISQLSPGEKGALLLVFYLLLDTEEIPIIIDQPEHKLDNESVVRLLVDCIRKARARRQVLIVTHNPNLAVYCDADQIICCKLDKTNNNTVDYSTGAIEDYDINSFAVNVLEGTYAAFDNRRKKWHKPQA
jgi:DNA repair exonuclease SbcCD ATPase subunit